MVLIIALGAESQSGNQCPPCLSYGMGCLGQDSKDLGWENHERGNPKF